MSGPTTIELHDYLLVGVDISSGSVILRMERVSIYQGDDLVRQEAGSLHLSAVRNSRVDDGMGVLQVQLEYGRVLDWETDNRVGRLLVEWVAYSPSHQRVTEWTFDFDNVRWETAYTHDH